MTDIAKCHGKDCPQRETCRRYLAAAARKGQAWASFDADRQRNGGACDGYWPIMVKPQ